MRHKNIEVNDRVKEQIYQYAGFNFSSNLILNQELSYENIYKSLNLGPLFNEICEELWIDSNIASEYIKKYTLHLILQDITDLKFQDRQLLNKIKDEEIGNQRIEYILDEIFYKTPRDLINILGNIKGYFTPQQIDAKLHIEYEFENWDEKSLTPSSQKKWMMNSKKPGSFYPLYVKYATRKSTRSEPLVKPYNKINNFKAELMYKQEHFNRFNEALELTDFSPSQDIWSFEYNTYLLMLLKSNNNKNSENVDEKHFPILASFLLVGDIRLKLLLTDTFFKEGFWSNYKHKIPHILLLSFIIIPFFKEFVKKQLMNFALETSPSNNNMIVNIDPPKMKLIDLKKQLYIYQILKTNDCYHGKSLASEFGIDYKSEVIITEGLKKIWKYMDHIRKKLESKLKNRSDNGFEHLHLIIFEHLEQYELFLELDRADQEGISINIRDCIDFGILEATKWYKENILRNVYDNIEVKDDFPELVGNKNDDARKIQLDIQASNIEKQKQFDEFLAKELAQLGITKAQLKAIAKKHNCAIIIEPDHISSKKITY